jgi:hypothetical protein
MNYFLENCGIFKEGKRHGNKFFSYQLSVISVLVDIATVFYAEPKGSWTRQKQKIKSMISVGICLFFIKKRPDIYAKGKFVAF